MLISFYANAQVATAEDNRKHVIKIKQTQDFEVTGDGNNAAWSNTEWVPVTARNNPSNTYHTTVKLLYSAQGIYCLFSCEDQKITATRTEDFSDLYNEDVVEVFFWPDESVPIYFEYELSPTNYELAILVPNMKGNAYGWRPWNYEGKRKTHHATKVTNVEKGVSAWTAEFFIPYYLLQPIVKTAPKKGDQWRANMYRIDYDNGTTHFSWQPTRKNFHDYERFGTILFD